MVAVDGGTTSLGDVRVVHVPILYVNHRSTSLDELDSILRGKKPEAG